MRREKGGKRGKEKMEERQEEREKEGGELEEMTEERTEGTEEREEKIEEREEGLQVTEEACEEDERCEEDSECQSAAKRARVCATFTDSQKIAIVEFVKEHPEMYDKEHGHFHDKHRKEALWAEISAELKLQPFDVRRWFESQRTRYEKLSKLQSGQAPREMTKRQSWVYQQMGFLKTHIRRKGANRSSGFEASLNTSRHEESRGSTTDTEHLESSVLRESASQLIITPTPVSTDSKIFELFDQMRTLISGFLQQKSDRQPFFDYVASDAEKMTQEEFEDLKGRIFRDIEEVKNTHRRQVLPKRSTTITRESQRVGILPTTTQQASSSTQAAAGSNSSSYVYYTPSPIGFGNPPSVLTLQDEGSRHNLSGILSQLPDLRTQITEQPQQQQQLYTITIQHRLNSSSLLSSQPVRVGLIPPPRAAQIFQKQLFSCKLFKCPSQNITVQYKYLSQNKTKKAQHPHHPKHETNNPW